MVREVVIALFVWVVGPFQQQKNAPAVFRLKLYVNSLAAPTRYQAITLAAPPAIKLHVRLQNGLRGDALDEQNG